MTYNKNSFGSLDAGLFNCLAIDDAFTVVMSEDAFVTSVEDVSNIELPRPEKGGVVENRNFKGDAEMFSCLTIDDVSTEAAKTKRNTTEDVSNTELSCPEKGGVDKNHNFKGDVELFSCLSIDAVPTKTAKTERDTVQDVSNTKLLCPEKGGEIQSLPTRTLQSRMVVQSKARFWRRSICCKLGNTSKSSVILITAKLFSVKSAVLTQSCSVVNNP